MIGRRGEGCRPVAGCHSGCPCARPRLPIRCLLLALCCAALPAPAPSADPNLPDYTRPAKTFPRLYQPYQPRRIPEAAFHNSDRAPLTVENGTLRLSLAQLVAAVVENNLSIASARYFPSIAQTDLLRARSGASPRGVDASQIPSGVFSGAEGGSILGTAGGGGGGSSNPGGITGSAGRVNIRPAGLFDPTVSFNFSMDRTASPLNSLVVAGVSSVTTNTAAFSANYTQAFATGTSFTLSYGVQRQGSTQQHLLFDPAITPGFTMTVSQQLLNGFGFDVNRALIKVAQNEQKIERESFRQQVTAALVAAENAYWDLLAAQESVHAAEQAKAVALQLEESNQRQFLIGTMANLDVVTAESQAAASERDLIVARTAEQNAELQLKSMLSQTLDEPLASAPIEIADNFPEAGEAPIPTQEQAVATAMANRPDLAVAEGNLKSQQDVLPFIRNALLPNFNVFGLVTTVGLYNVFGTSFTEAVHFRYPEVAFGVTVTFPLRNRQAQADDVRSRLELRQSKDTLVRSKSQVEVDVQNGLIALRQSKAQVAAAREAVRLERAKSDAERQKLANGLSTSYNVILAQRDLFTAELAEAQARDAFAKAGIALDQATGVTLEANHISLDEALRGRLSGR
jgi:outer membrane protein